MSDQEGFLTNLKTVELFFRLCRRYRIDGREDRILLLRELTRRKKAAYLRDVKPLLAGKRVLKVGFKPLHNPGPEHWCLECCPNGKPKGGSK